MMQLQFAAAVLLALLVASPAKLSAQPPVAEDAVASPYPGYTLIAPLGSTDSFLINMDGTVVHQWSSQYQPGNSAYLLPDGSLLRTAKTENRTFDARGGIGGRVQRFDWDGTLTWDFVYSDDKVLHHHDIEPMPNGNVLLIAWEYKSYEEAIAAGRDPAKLDNDLWPETIVEIKPQGLNGGDVVWKWSMWDHLIQAHDQSKPNFGRPDGHPELIDLNYAKRNNADWIHMNSVAYNADLDQIVMSARWFDELWIIDHSTTTEQAASHEGGAIGKGGDLLYRWGNPFTYFAGLPDDKQFFGQHDARWIPNGFPGAGNLLIFNNGGERSGREYSSVDEVVPPINEDGSYTLSAIDPYGPAKPSWSYLGTRTVSSRTYFWRRAPAQWQHFGLLRYRWMGFRGFADRQNRVGISCVFNCVRRTSRRIRIPSNSLSAGLCSVQRKAIGREMNQRRSTGGLAMRLRI